MHDGSRTGLWRNEGAEQSMIEGLEGPPADHLLATAREGVAGVKMKIDAGDVCTDDFHGTKG